MANYCEILNHNRIQLDEFVERHGPENTVNELKSIFVEKAGDHRRGYEEREYMKTALEPKGLRVDNVDEAVGQLFDAHGGAAILEALIKKVEVISEHWDDADMKKQCAKQIAALQMKSVRDAWGL